MRRRYLSQAVSRAFFIFLFMLTPLVSVSVGAQDANAERFGNVIFRVPEGWRRVEQKGALLLVPPYLPAGEGSVLIVLPGQDLRGDFRAAFDSVRATLERGERVLSENPANFERNANGFDTLSTLALTEDRAGKRTFRFYLAAHAGSRIAMFVFAATSDELLRRYVPAFKEFVSSVSFANLKNSSADFSSPPRSNRSLPSVSAAGRGAAGLSGLYVATESRQQFNVNTKFYDYIVRQVYYLFSPDGQVYRGLPKGGALDDFDFARAAREDPANLGAYRLTGGAIQFAWNGGGQTSLAFSGGGDSLRIGNLNFLRVGGAGTRSLEGVYGRGSFTNLSGGAGVASGGVSSDNLIAFSRDGRFAQRGFVGFAGSGAGGGAAVSRNGQATGSYRISGNTLELRYDNGGAARYTFFLYPREPNVIVIDGATYLRRER